MPEAPAVFEENRVSHVKSDSSVFHTKAVELGRHVLQMTTAAGSGHPSTALALSHLVVELMYRQMRHDPKNPWNPHNDRLVLSVGHAVPIIYAAYADLGGAVGNSPESRRFLGPNDLASLRELNSVLDGHPNPAEGFPFFDAATGSLGQGLSVAGGLALAAKLDGIDKRIYCIIGDGESREGQIWEAVDFIADYGLTNVCAVFSCNGHGQAGPVSAQQSAEVIAAKLAAFQWEVIRCDGHDPIEVHEAFERTKGRSRPAAIVATTVKGWGLDLMLGKNYHGKPLSVEELEKGLQQLDAAAKRLGSAGTFTQLPQPPAAPSYVRGMSRAGVSEPRQPISERRPSGSGSLLRSAESRTAVSLPPIAQALRKVGLDGALSKTKLATRQAYGAALVALGDVDPRVVSLDGDVSNSTFANMFAKAHPERFFECKIAEQNMISAAAGLAAAGKVPFASSFGKFLARAADQIDMAVISRANIKIVGSHCGVSLGADGPSQMAVSDVAYFRSMSRVRAAGFSPRDASSADTRAGTHASRTPAACASRSGVATSPTAITDDVACRVFHPSDAISAYRCVELMANVHGMCYLRTHRPDAPFLYNLDEKFDLCGCKQFRQGLHLTLVSAGYMLHTVLEGAAKLAQRGIECNVFDAYAFPLDAGPILEAARAANGAVLVVEDNYAGGLHAELAEAAAERGDIRVIGMTANRIPKSAKTAEEVFGYVGIGLDDILARATALL